MPRSAPTFLSLFAIGLLGAGAAPAQVEPPGPITPDARSREILQQRTAKLSKLSPVTDAMLREPPPGDWLQWRRTYDAHGFSPLTQINIANVASLRPAWSWSLPANTAEIVPLVHDGVLFVYGSGDRIQALDAATGDLLWEYIHPAPGPPWDAMGTGYRRNFAIYGDKLYFPTADSHEVALDIKTGKVVWDHAIGTPQLPYRTTSGPLVVKGKVMQGMMNCSRLQPGGCFIVALDAETGAEKWRVYTIARPGEPGDKTWNGAPLADRQGSSVWSTGSYDPDLDLVYFGTGNTYNWQALVRGDTRQDPRKAGLYTDSTLAISPDTGKLVWYYQHLPQDMWNQDWSFERIIATVPDAAGKPQKLVLSTGKMAITDGIDAATGKWVFSADQGLQNYVLSIDPVTGTKTYSEAVLPDLTLSHTNLECPSLAKSWPSNAYDPTTKLLYIVMSEGCNETLPRRFDAEEPYQGGDQTSTANRYPPNSDGNIGRIDAVDVQTRRTVWSKRQRVGMSSAALATAGGLLFVGDGDRWFRAYNSQTGEILWQMRLSHSLNSFPITYSVNGKQYVAVTAGQGLFSHPLTPEVRRPAGGGAVLWVFELPGHRTP